MADTEATATNNLPLFNAAALQYSFSRRSPKRPRPISDDADLDGGGFLGRGPPAAGIDDIFGNVRMPWHHQASLTVQQEAPVSVPSRMPPATRTISRSSHQLPNNSEVSFPLSACKAPESFPPLIKEKRARMAFNWDCIKNINRRIKISRWKGKKISISQGLSNPKKYPKRQDYAQNRPRKNGRFVSATDPSSSSNGDEPSPPINNQ